VSTYRPKIKLEDKMTRQYPLKMMTDQPICISTLRHGRWRQKEKTRLAVPLSPTTTCMKRVLKGVASVALQRST